MAPVVRQLVIDTAEHTLDQFLQFAWVVDLVSVEARNDVAFVKASLGGRAMTFSADTALLGALPELDSMAVVTLINNMEERFGISVNDDEISGDTFGSVGSLTRYVANKLAS